MVTTSANHTCGIAGILQAIAALKNYFGSMMEFLPRLSKNKLDFKAIVGRLEQAENHVGDTEDDIAGEETRITSLEKQMSGLGTVVQISDW